MPTQVALIHLSWRLIAFHRVSALNMFSFLCEKQSARRNSAARSARACPQQAWLWAGEEYSGVPSRAWPWAGEEYSGVSLAGPGRGRVRSTRASPVGLAVGRWCSAPDCTGALHRGPPTLPCSAPRLSLPHTCHGILLVARLMSVNSYLTVV